ncbi:MAG: HAD-IIB family hydrolase [Bdellovibrionales bacterium]|nr:HAD-IIB family hydrolase [Bdellovibrionales bacterium]
MKELHDFNSSVNLLFTDIDDTMTDHGQLGPEAYQTLWDLKSHGVEVVPITGRPAGWCEMIARMWPVAGVVGENGGFYFRYRNKEMIRYFSQDEGTRKANQLKLEKIKAQVLAEIPKAGIASDQFCRVIDLAIDFCEDVEPLSKRDVHRIKEIFEENGAQAKISSIHVNGWFGEHDKLSMCRQFIEREWDANIDEIQSQIAFVGDSPNDEPMFEFFENSFAVANIDQFVSDLKSLPKFRISQPGGKGFSELGRKLIELKQS